MAENSMDEHIAAVTKTLDDLVSGRLSHALLKMQKEHAQLTPPDPREPDRVPRLTRLGPAQVAELIRQAVVAAGVGVIMSTGKTTSSRLTALEAKLTARLDALETRS